jgi:hypothetical protein
MAMLTKFWSALSMGERAAVGGAAAVLVIGEWLLGDLLHGSGVSITTALGCAEIILLVYIRWARPSIAWPVPYTVLLAGFAVLVAVPTISDILFTVSNAGNLGGGVELLSQLVSWIGAGAIAFGAYLIWRADTPAA